MKLVAIVLCAALFSQTLGGSGKDDAKTALEKLMNIIDRALTKAQAAFDKAMTTVKEKVTQLTAEANSKLDPVLAPLREKLDKLVAKAKAKGFDVAKCQEYVDKFSHRPNDLVNNLGNCVNSQVSKGQGYIDDALKNAKQIEQDIANVRGDIDNCSGNGFKKAKCYAKLIGKISRDTDDSPKQIAEDVTKAIALVTGIIPILEACAVDQLKGAGEDAAKDVAEFALCAAL